MHVCVMCVWAYLGCGKENDPGWGSGQGSPGILEASIFKANGMGEGGAKTVEAGALRNTVALSTSCGLGHSLSF